MAIRHKRKSTTGYVWDTADLVEGQIGLNITDATLHIKDAGGVVRKVGDRNFATTASVTTAIAQQSESLIVAAGDESTALTTGAAKVTFRMPFAMTLTAVRASVTTAPTGGTLLTIDINDNGVSILSTKLTFNSGSKTTVGATTPAVFSSTSLADDDEITIDIDAVGNTIAGAGLKVTLIGTRA